MPSRDVPQPSGSDLVIPPCKNCQTTDHVRAIELHDTSTARTGVHFWKCDKCGFVWATREGKTLRTIW
jgi:hypothetical protein